MNRNEIAQVLGNWIREATSPPGSLPEEIDRPDWVARQFLNWWHPLIEESLGSAELAVARARDELNRLGGWENEELGEALHELTHAAEAHAELRTAFGVPFEPDGSRVP